MKKKILSLILACGLVISMTACGAPAGNTAAPEAPAAESAEAPASEEAGNPDEWPSVVMEVISFTDEQAQEATVENALNDYLVSINAGVKADLLPLAFGDRGTQITLLLSEPDALDLFCWRFYSTVDGLVKNDQVISLDQYKDQYPELWELYPESVYDTCTINGHLYSLPGADSFGNFNCYVMRKDVAEDIGVMDKVNTKITMDELNEMLLKAKEVHPEYCYQTTTDFVSLMGIDNLGNPDAIGVLLNRGVDQTEIVNYYETDEFREYCELCRFWWDNGLIVDDPLTTDKGGIMGDGISAGGFVDGYSLDYIYSLMAAQLPMEVVLFQMNDYVGTNSCVYNGWNISSNCTHPDAAMKLLSILATDATAANIVSMGVEGVTYVLDEKGCAWYPEGLDANTVGWNCNAPWWYPNECLTHPFETEMETYFTDMEACWFDEDSKFSSAMGFVFDNTEVYDEMTACSAVIGEYRDALWYGQVDIDTTLPKFIDELKAAGIDKVIAAENEQFQAFLAAKQ